MTATLTAPEATATTPDVPAAGGSPRVRGMAVALWGVVGSLLGYGIFMTVLKAAALFA